MTNDVSLPILLIVDDHPLFRDALAMAVKSSGQECSVKSASSISQALELVSEASPNLTLLDLNLHDSKGLDTLLQFQTGAPNQRIAVISASEDHATVERALALGAVGYIPKSAAIDELSQAVKTLLEGGAWSPEIQSSDDDDSKQETELAARLASLTPAQRRVLSGLKEGLLNKQIAYDMGISEATVKAHMTAIFRKLGVNSRTQALLILQQVTS